ncbi:MAG: hypothetical protein K0R84_1061 [Clostridia bacterium]|nr:hypothetical protein [Clostridia bacterium]
MDMALIYAIYLEIIKQSRKMIGKVSAKVYNSYGKK